MLNVYGAVVFNLTALQTHKKEIDLTDAAKGIYFIETTDSNSHKTILKSVKE